MPIIPNQQPVIGLASSKDNPYLKHMITSRLTTKSQTTIPQSVRLALGLQPGDAVAYIIEEGRVILTRAASEPEQDDPFATFGEWGSPEDVDAYAGL